MAGCAVDADYLKLELNFHCRGLKKMDTFSSTDAFCVIYLNEPNRNTNTNTNTNQNNNWGGNNRQQPSSQTTVEICRTEVICK